MDVLDIVKSKFPEPIPPDSKLLPLIDEVEQTILNYCNLKEVPPQLKYVHANMVIDLYNYTDKAGSDEGLKAVASIKEGDTTVQFGSASTGSTEHAMKDILFDYKGQLNSFRKLRW